MKIDYETKITTIDGKETDLKNYTGDVLLVVNTASFCGYTNQYSGLEALYNRYKSRGFSVLGFPCNQFAFQEPGTDEGILEFCTKNYSVTFPMFSKIKVNGKSIIVDQIKIEPVTFSFSLLLIFKVITPPIT